MRGNDLGNRIVPRDVLVWEGLLGLLPDERTRKQEAKFRSRRKWQQAVDLYQINEIMARKIWDLAWRFDVEVNLLTFLGPEFAEALEARVIDRENLPLRHVWSERPDAFARSLAYQPDLRHVYDPDPAHQFLYGAKGRILSPDQAHLFGAL